MKIIPFKTFEAPKTETRFCNRCHKKIKEDSDWQLIAGDPLCEKCVDSGILFGAPKKETLGVLKKRKKKNKVNWKNPTSLKKYWNKRYPTARKDLCSCGNPKRKESDFCKSCHNKNLIFSEKKHIRDSGGRFKKKIIIKGYRNAPRPIRFNH